MGPEVAAAVMAISAIAGAGMGIYGAVQQHEAAEEQERLANKNAEMMEAEAEESARRLETENERTEAFSRAMAAASGVGGESQQSYLDEMVRTGNREESWIRKSGRSQAKITRQEGRMQANAAKTEAWMTGVQAGFQGVSGAYSAGSDVNWWKG